MLLKNYKEKIKLRKNVVFLRRKVKKKRKKKYMKCEIKYSYSLLTCDQ